LLEARSISSSNNNAPRFIASITGPSCQTVCPSNCIDIVAEEAPWEDRDKRPKIFEIDMLRCIYCGMCEEACPCDAIELTEKLYTVSTSRAEMIYDKEKLLSN